MPARQAAVPDSDPKIVLGVFGEVPDEVTGQGIGSVVPGGIPIRAASVEAHQPVFGTEPDEALRILTTPHGGVTMVTLAPEKTTPAHIRALTDAGVIVSAGHTDATYDELQPALAQGLRGFTHLFNAMSQLGNRDPGAVGAALSADCWCGLIVDGQHVHSETLKIALRAKPHRQFMLVTDAMPSVGAATRSFQIQGRTITVVPGVDGDKIIDEDGRLAGAHLDMAGAVHTRQCAPRPSLIQVSTTVSGLSEMLSIPCSSSHSARSG